MRKKESIGYTTGVFDLFHVGHLNILKRAKAQCNVLIVGVSTDELAESYKHKKPVIPFGQRMEIVKAIRYVDKVVPQTTMNKMDAYHQIGFDVMFHGDDWKGSALYHQIKKELAEVGVDLIFLEHTTGISSSELLGKIEE